jgi:hypothetical protein
MSTVVVERAFPEAVALEDVQAFEERAAPCLQAHGVRLLKSYLSRDRRRMTCLFEAADAESVRLAQEKAGAPFERAWSARVIRYERARESDGDAVVLQRTFPQPRDENSLRAGVEREASCLEEWGCRAVWSYLSLDGLRCVCVFAAPDTESLRHVQRATGTPFDAAWPATVHEPKPSR